MVDGSRRITLRNRKFLRKIDRPESKHFPDQEPQTQEIETDDEAEFYTPNQSPIISRANSQENLQGDIEEAIEIADQDQIMPRRSARANKGQTTRYQEYDLQHLDEASATELPIILIDKEGEDVTSVTNTANVVIGDKDQKHEKEIEFNSIAAAIWRPWI